MRRYQCAFTLVELLVVISALVLLLALLMPALSRAKESALTVACASNLHQLHSAFSGYAQDSRGWLPDTGVLKADSAASGNWRWHMLWVWEQKVTRLLRREYLGDDYRVMLCPSARKDRSESYWERASEPATIWTSYASLSSSFLIGEIPDNKFFVADSPDQTVDYCETVSRSESDFVLMTDMLWLSNGSSWWGGIGKHPGRANQGFLSARGANVLRVDGAAAWRDIQQTAGRIFPWGFPNRVYYW